MHYMLSPILIFEVKCGSCFMLTIMIFQGKVHLRDWYEFGVSYGHHKKCSNIGIILGGC